MSKKNEKRITCAICTDVISDATMNNGCNHEFCFTCIETWSRTTNSCPLCKARFTYLTRLDALTPTKRKSTEEKKRRTRSATHVKVPERNQEPKWDRDELERLGVRVDYASDVDDAVEDSEQERRNTRRRRAQRIGSREPDSDYEV